MTRTPADDHPLRRYAALAGVVVFALIPTATVRAQTAETGSVRGVVSDSGGARLAGVRISIARPDGSYRRSVESDTAGHFRLSLLPPGDYTLLARRVGYQPLQVTAIAIRAGELRPLDLRLTRSVTELETMEVRAEDATVIRRNDTEVRTKLGSEEIARLPVGIDVNRVVGLTPGARPDGLWGGASEQANGYLLDGLSFNHPGIGGTLLEPSLSWLEEVEVRGLGAGAEYGSFQGGVVNVVTKSGTNTRQNRLHVYDESNSESASNLTTSEVIPEISRRRLIDAHALGPLVRDRLYYFVSGQLLTTRWRALDHAEQNATGGRFSPLEQQEQDARLLLKTTWTPSSSDLVNGVVMLGHTRGTHFGLSGRESEDATLDRSAPTVLLSGTWQRALGASSHIDARALVYGTRDERTSARGLGVPGIQTYELANFREYQNASFSDDTRTSGSALTLTWKGNYQRSGWFENVRAGIDVSQGNYRELHLRNGGLTWRPRRTTGFDPRSTATWHQTNQVDIPLSTGGETRLAGSVRNTAVWAEDDFGVGRFTIIRGARVNLFQGALANAASSPNRPVWRALAWEPRVGAVLDLSRHHSRDLPPVTALKVHWGKYHQHLFTQMFDRASGGNVFTDQEFWEYGGSPILTPLQGFSQAQRDFLAAEGDIRLLERATLSQSGPLRNVRQPHVLQTVASLETTPVQGFKGELVYVYRSYRDAIALVDRNRDRNYTPFFNVGVRDHIQQTLFDASGHPVVLPVIYIRNDAILHVLRHYQGVISVPGFSAADTANLSFDPLYELVNAPELVRELRQVQANVHLAMFNWTGMVSVVWTDLFGNQASVTGYDDTAIHGRDNVRGRGPGSLVRRNEAINNYGKLENYTPLEVKARLSGSLPWGFSGGAQLQHRLGDRVAATFNLTRLGFNYYVNESRSLPLHGILLSSVSGEKLYYDPRGGGHYGHNTLLDLQLMRDWSWRGRSLRVGVEALNVLGNRAPLAINTALEAQGDVNASSGFGSVLERVPPRRARLFTTLEF